MQVIMKKESCSEPYVAPEAVVLDICLKSRLMQTSGEDLYDPDYVDDDLFVE